jgi:hypothetical protein
VNADEAIAILKQRVESGLMDLAAHLEPDELIAYVEQLAARMRREIEEEART